MVLTVHTRHRARLRLHSLWLEPANADEVKTRELATVVVTADDLLKSRAFEVTLETEA